MQIEPKDSQQMKEILASEVDWPPLLRDVKELRVGYSKTNQPFVLAITENGAGLLITLEPEAA